MPKLHIVVTCSGFAVVEIYSSVHVRACCYVSGRLIFILTTTNTKDEMGNKQLKYHYQILKIRKDASQSDIEKAYADFDLSRLLSFTSQPMRFCCCSVSILKYCLSDV